MHPYSEEPDLAAANLIPEVDKAAEHKKYKQTMKYFDFAALITHGVGVIMMVLSGFIFGTVSGGLQWSEDHSKVQSYVNFHGFLMTLGFIFFQGEALLAYRIHRHEIKLFSKIIHGAFHVFAMCSFGTGLAAILKFKAKLPLKHFYSFHSWIGGILILSYILQFIGGFVNYAFPKTSIKVRKSLLPFHRGAGKILLGVSVAQILSGHGFYYSQHLQPYENNKYNGTEHAKCALTLNCPNHLDVIYNFCVLSIIIYVGLVYTLVSKDTWIRRPTPDEIKQD